MASRELNILIKAQNLAGSVLKGVKNDLRGLDRVAGKAGRNVAANFERGVIAAGAGIGAFTVATVKTAMDFEDAFAGVKKTVDEVELAAAGLSFDDLMGDFRQMARDMPIAFEELASIGEAAGALGIAAGDIDDFTEVVAKLGVTTDLTTDQASTALGHLGTILGLTGSDFEELADSLVALGNDGASTESQIIDIAERFAAAGNLAGLTKEEILALASTTASMGVDAEAAGSSLSRIFNNVATDIGTANEKSEAFADALGLTAGELKKRWKDDALGTFQDFLKVLSDLDQFDQAALLESIGVTGIRDINAIQLLSQGYEELADQLETSRSAQGALNEEAQKKFATTASQVERFKNVLRDAGYVVGKELLPVVNDLLTDFTNFMAQESTQEGIKRFAQDFAQGARDFAKWLKELDWGEIADSLKTAAGFAKGLIDAFLGAPDWLKTAVITGWGLNKVTGGALGDIIGMGVGGGLKGLFSGLRGSTPATPMYTKEVGLPGTGGPGGGPIVGGGGRGGAAGRGGGGAGGGGFSILRFAGLAAMVNQPDTVDISDLSPEAQAKYQAALEATGFGDRGSKNLTPDSKTLNARNFEAAAATAARQGAKPVVESVSQVRERINAASRTASVFDTNMLRSADRQTSQLQSQIGKTEQVRALQAAQHARLQRIEGIEAGNSGKLTGILNKKASVTINTTVNVSLQEWQRKQISSIRAASNSGGFI